MSRPPNASITEAERARTYRAKRKAEGHRDTRQRSRPGQNNRHATRWDIGEFVAIDGEGFSEGAEFRVQIGAHRTVYTGRQHYYAYLAASDGSSIYSADGRLTGAACLDFLCDIRERNPNAILVVFGGSYDICHMVAHSFDANEIKQLLGKGKTARKLECQFGDFQYRLEYRARKSFTIRRWPIGVRKTARDASGGYKLTPHTLAVVWDVWGFFQDSFVGVMKKWLPNDPDFNFIQRMKGDRNIFERSEFSEIKTYNDAELRCLVKIMESVRAAINDLGLKITRWDGAGAIAAAFMAKHKVKQHMMMTPQPVFIAARGAYSGGHIETHKVGYHDGTVYHYDLNSAYPDKFRRLPALNTGRWVHGTGDAGKASDFTLVRVRFDFGIGKTFYPLFFRCDDGSIIYPRRGSGWYWWPEFLAAKSFSERIGCVIFECVEWWRYDNDIDIAPFGWVEHYYHARQEYIAEARERGVESGAEKIIKLGLSSLYGKTAQQVGARIDRDGNLKLPSYFQLEWAGWVTSACRAQLMEAAIQKPDAIIGIATDGIFSTEPLDLCCPATKELGAWEFKRHTGITMVMPGVYWLHDGEKLVHHSRGFNKKEMSDVEFIHAAWRSKKPTVAITIERLIGLGSASMSREFWKMRGCFVKSARVLRLDGDNSKRYPITLSACRPDRGLIATIPRDHEHKENYSIDELISAPYPIAWIDDGASIDRDMIEGERAEDGEMLDAELA